MNIFHLQENELIKIHNALSKTDGVIAFPTDTVWGIGCLVENKDAVDRIYHIKNRSKIKPLILLGSKIDYLVPYLNEIPEKAWEIINKYLPGAVTLVLPKNKKTPDYITSGFDTVGIRIPNNPPLIDLLENSVKDHVLATTSANISDTVSSLTKKDVENSVGDFVDYILDDYGFICNGTESTVLSVDRTGNIKILRQGAVEIKI
ncbi:MAG: L-threonylcarbamoyladenylate synthase [Candidatus Gastranaerophilales bacterium]|nr:L-threonylcarbamoyladenylate synthase [Candidatus Gastranaerophilales bacterium]